MLFMDSGVRDTPYILVGQGYFILISTFTTVVDKGMLKKKVSSLKTMRCLLQH